MALDDCNHVSTGIQLMKSENKPFSAYASTLDSDLSTIRFCLWIKNEQSSDVLYWAFRISDLTLNKSQVSQYLICRVLLHHFRALLARLGPFLRALRCLSSLLIGQVLLRRQLWLVQRVGKVFGRHCLDYDSRVRHLHCNVVAQAVSLITCKRLHQISRSSSFIQSLLKHSSE